MKTWMWIALLGGGALLFLSTKKKSAIVAGSPDETEAMKELVQYLAHAECAGLKFDKAAAGFVFLLNGKKVAGPYATIRQSLNDLKSMGC